MLSVKLLLPLGIGIAGLVAAAGRKSASAAPLQPTGPKAPASPTTKPAAGGGLTTAQVVELMTKAIASADPAVINDLATRLDKGGFASQAADLRGVATALLQAGAAAAGASPPKVDQSKPTTPVASIPPAQPAAPVSVPPMLTVPALQPTPITSPGLPQRPIITVLPEQIITASGPTTAERNVAQQLAINQQSKPKWQDNRDLTTVFQTQEAKAGRYKNIITGEPATIDGLYGPGSAILLAEQFGMVPPNPKYWPTNPAPSLAAYKRRLTALAAADPARSTEWLQAAQNAKVVK